MKTFKQVMEDKKIPKGYHRMPDGTLMKNSDHPKKLRASYEDTEVDEVVSPAQRRARKQASNYERGGKNGHHKRRDVKTLCRRR